VSLTASVRDRDGKFVADLRQDEFVVMENGVRQQLAHFAPVEQPFSVVLLLDTSGSTKVRLQDIQDSAIAFIEQLKPNDRVLPITFDNEVIALLPDWTSDRDALRRAIQSARTGIERAPTRTAKVRGRSEPVTVIYVNTRLYEAVHRAAELLTPVKGRKAVILLSDGFDTGGGYATFKSTLSEAEELGALIYPVQYCDCEIRDPFDKWTPTRRANEYLESLAGKSGGRFYRAKDMKKIRGAFTSIAEELRHTYSLGYYPQTAGERGVTRKVKIKVNRPKLVVREGKTYIFQPPAPR
jgi:VWFA-related protein